MRELPVAIVTVATLPGMAWSAAAQAPSALYTYVDPRIGVGNDDQGDTIPGPTLPAGSIHPSPETLTGSNAGYDPAAPISGFGQLHTQGSGGRTTYGTFLISPQTGSPRFAEAEHLSPKADERFGADAYSVRLTRYDTRVEIAPAHHAAIYRMTFPAGETANIMFDITRKIRGELASDEAEVTLDPATGTIAGRVRAKTYWSPALVDIWFHAQVDRPPVGWGVVIKGQAHEGDLTAGTGPDEGLGAWWSFGKIDAATPIRMKIAVSFTSAARASELLMRDIPDWDFEAVRRIAQERWDKALGRIRIDGVGDADKRRFYTALYHSMIQPRDRTLDQPASRRDIPLWDDHYTLWDTYRTLFPLLSIIRPSDYAGNVRSMIATYDRFGASDTAFIAGRNYHVGQGGDEVDNVIGEGFVRGVAGIDWKDAARVTRFNALERRRPRYLIDGWVAAGDRSPEMDNQRARSGSSTLGFALNDHYAALLARAAGREDEATMLAGRSGSWRKVWNATASSDGYAGFILPRLPDGGFQNVDPKIGWDGKTYNNVGFYEGTAWVYSYAMLHDVPGMIAAMGGRDRFVARLSHALDSGLIDITNEPSFATPWLFTDAGRPDLASFWANRVFERFTPDAYPGDEDAGAMSSHYVFNRIGLFPKLTTDLYYLHAPHQPKAVIALENGRHFTIVARNWAPGRIYIRSARLNGRPLTTPFLRQSEIMAGGTLEFDLSTRPGSWARTDMPVAGRQDNPPRTN